MRRRAARIGRTCRSKPSSNSASEPTKQVPTRVATSLKDRCLTVCRHPGAYLLQHYRRGVGGAFRLGAGHGLFCVGCCWALMLVGFAAGVANLWWMATLTTIMVFEKTAPAGRRGVRPIGLGLIVLGCVLLADPAAPAWILAPS